MRDYATLIEAIRDANIPCHIAAKIDVGKTDPWMTDLRDVDQLPPHITFGPEAVSRVARRCTRARASSCCRSTRPTPTTASPR